ncbi:ABC transporter permease [Devosia sp. A449]
MFMFILSRLLRALATLFIIVTFAFVILRIAGDPVARFYDVATTPPEVIAAFRIEWGLDKPLWQQFTNYIGSVLTGDLGNSMRESRPALVTVLARLPLTLQLAVPVLFLKVLIGVTIGIFAALHRNSIIDRALMMISVLGITVPTFVIGLVLAMIFAVQLRWLPSGGYTELRHMILPVATMTIAGSAVIARYTRSAMLEVLGQPFVRAASAKGLKSNLVILRHVLPNAAISIITIFGLMLGGLIGGAVVVESVFSWPGVGRLLIDSVSSRDLAVVQTILLMIGLTMVISNLFVDLLYGLIDPRMRDPRHTGQ